MEECFEREKLEGIRKEVMKNFYIIHVLTDNTLYTVGQILPDIVDRNNKRYFYHKLYLYGYHTPYILLPQGLILLHLLNIHRQLFSVIYIHDD